MSVTKLLYHIVIRTKNSIPAINEENERDFYAFVYNYCLTNRCVVQRIGGMPDHVHLLLFIPADMALSEFVKGLKLKSGRWMRSSDKYPLFNGWGKEYAAFTYAFSDRDVVKRYIMNQKEHHKRLSLREEVDLIFKEFANEDKVDYFMND